jgi:hypothetical protein
MTTNLRSAKSAAERLGVSVKTLNGYVRDGELRYILVGSGNKKPRRRFTDPDLDDLIEATPGETSPCRMTWCVDRGTLTAKPSTMPIDRKSSGCLSISPRRPILKAHFQRSMRAKAAAQQHYETA